MKKILRHSIGNQEGSMFLYLFYFLITILALMLILFQQLQTEQTLSVLELEHMQLEMIHQQAYQSLMIELENGVPEESLIYNFPNGWAKINIVDKHNDYYDVTILAYREPPYEKIKEYKLNKDDKSEN